LLQARIRECSQKLSHSPHAYIPGLPVLALDSGLLTVLIEDEVDAAIGVCAASSGDTVAELAVSGRDNFLKLEPVDSAKPLSNAGQTWSMRSCHCGLVEFHHRGASGKRAVFLTFGRLQRRKVVHT